LSSILFGYIKGAFSGAEKDTDGLISQAEGGYLFLDEIHNLSEENQEKLFLLLDEKKYRPLGSNAEWKKANIRLIMATTKNPDSSLLITFKRRIPFVIFLPDFKKRTFYEKEQLVLSFFKQESIELDKSIKVSEKFTMSLIDSDFKGNIGQIRNTIKVECAKAYKNNQDSHELIIGKQPFISIDSSKDIRRPKLLKTHKLLKKYLQSAVNTSFEENSKKILDLVDQTYLQWSEQKGLIEYLPGNIEIKRFFSKKEELETHFRHYGLETNQFLIDRIILCTILVKYFLANANEDIKILNLIEAKRKFHKYFILAEGILKNLFVSDSSFIENEIALLAAYLVNIIEIKSQINALIIMHGEQNATTLSRAANQLIGDFVFESFDMPIELSINELIDNVNLFIQNYNTTNGLLLLVDMGSLEQMYKKIQQNVSGDLLIMNNVSTSLALDIGFKLTQNKNISEIEQVGLEEFAVSKQYYEGVSKHTNLLISCISGEGIAIKIKEILGRYIEKNKIDLLSMDYMKLTDLLKKDQKSLFKDTVAILTTSNIENAIVPVINIEDIINGSDDLNVLQPFFDSIEEITKCTNEIIKLFTLEGASSRLEFLNPVMVIDEVEKVIESYEKYYQIEIKSFMRINLFLHLSTMIERILIGDGIDDVEIQITDNLNYQSFKEHSLYFFKKISNKYKIDLPEGELKMIYLILREQIT
jgi:transcriptional regulatory protein LevR